MENQHYYDLTITFDFEYNGLEHLDIDTRELDSHVREELETTLTNALNADPDIVVDQCELDVNNEPQGYMFYITSPLDVTSAKNKVLEIIRNHDDLEFTEDLPDGTYYEERHGLEHPPYEILPNEVTCSYSVDPNLQLTRFVEVDEFGNEFVVESVSKNELKARARKHAKRQKGLSPFCSLGESDDKNISLSSAQLSEGKRKKKSKYNINYNAGNVEHNINMFNKMNSPTEAPIVNPISGPFGGDVGTTAASGDGAAMGESLKSSATYKVVKFNWSPDEVTVTCLDTTNNEEFEKFLCYGAHDENTGRRNSLMLLKDSEFEIPEDIKNELISTYGLDDFGYKIEECKTTKPVYEGLDDIFDMSMRTLL